MDDILKDTIALFGEEPDDDESIQYGPLLLKTAPKVRQIVFIGKASYMSYRKERYMLLLS